MADLRSKSSLSIEEIEGNFKDVDFFAGIMDGLQDALSPEKGSDDIATEKAQIGMNRHNYESIQISTVKPAK